MVVSSLDHHQHSSKAYFHFHWTQSAGLEVLLRTRAYASGSPLDNSELTGITGVLAGVGTGFAGTGVAFGAGVGTGVAVVFAFAGGVLGVGVGFAAVFVFAGIGTRTTPPSIGMN